MKKVYIASALRTAIGTFCGSLSTTSPSDYGSAVVRKIMEDTKVDPSDIEEVIVGNILPAGQGQSFGRQIVIKAGLPIDIPAYTINIACGSGLKAVMNAYSSILSGQAKMIIAGGSENMSQAPYLLPKEVRNGGIKMGNFNVVDHLIYDALTDYYNNYHMGITAENIASKYSISREQQDKFAFSSQQKASSAIESGKFKQQIVPISVKGKKEDFIFEKDEHPKLTSLEKLSSLKPAFKKDGGTITAGNASGINDAASFLLICDQDMISKYNLKPLAEIVSIGQGGVEPEVMGLGPIPATEKALSKAGLSLGDIEIIELNEAFAAQSLGVMEQWNKNYGISESELNKKINPLGGAIALGHPTGASGACILTKLVHQLKDSKDKLGLATLCIGGGMGVALVIKSL